MSDRIHILTDEMADDALQTACGRIRALEAANTALTEAGVRVIAQRDALEAELAENREVQRRALQIIEFADGHPDMCCGKCSREIHEAERERDALAEQNRVLLDAVDRLALTNAVVEAARKLRLGGDDVGDCPWCGAVGDNDHLDADPTYFIEACPYPAFRAALDALDGEGSAP